MEGRNLSPESISTAAARRRGRERQARLVLIREAGARVFAQHGYKNSTMAMVAREAELGKASLYYYFETKRDLFADIVLQAIEERSACPGCGRHTKEDWVVCPNCYTKLMKPCHSCNRLMKLPWSLCPYCGTPEPGKRIEDLTFTEATRSVDIQEVEEDWEEELSDEPTIPREEMSDEDMIDQL